MALRITYDAINAAGGIQSIEVTRGMIQAAKNTHGKYLEFTKKKKIQEDEKLEAKQAKRMAEEIRQLNI